MATTTYNLKTCVHRIDGSPLTNGQLLASDGSPLLHLPADVNPQDKPAIEAWLATPAPIWRLAQKAVLEVRLESETPENETQKFERYQLAQKLTGGEDVELTDADVATINRLCAAVYSIELIGCIRLALTP